MQDRMTNTIVHEEIYRVLREDGDCNWIVHDVLYLFYQLPVHGERLEEAINDLIRAGRIEQRETPIIRDTKDGLEFHGWITEYRAKE